MTAATENGSDSVFFVDGEYLTADRVQRLFASERMADRSERCLRLLEGRHIVDVGCYTGTFVRRAQRLYPDREVIGVDYDDENLKLARFLHPEHAASFRKMSVYSLDFPDASVDCIAFQEVIEHIEGAALAIKELNRVLKPGGSLIVTTPHAYYWRHFVQFLRSEIKSRLLRLIGRKPRLASQIFFDNVEWNRHIYCWTPGTLLTLLEINGFEYHHHEFSADDTDLLGRIVARLAPSLGNTIVLKVRKMADAPAKMV